MVTNKFCNKQQGDNMKSKDVRENHSTKVRKPTRITWEKVSGVGCWIGFF